MHLLDEIRALAARSPATELVARMGYSAKLDQHASRITRVLEDADMGLAGGEYDFVHDSRGFLLALCKALGMDEAASALRLDDIIDRIHARDTAFRPWLRVESREADAAARGRGMFSNWGASIGRKLPLPAETKGAPLEDIIIAARKEIRRHMLDTGGNLKSGAGIDSYLLVHRTDHPALRMDAEGNVLGVQTANRAEA